MIAHKWDPGRGKWKLSQLIREYLKGQEYPVHVDQLIRHLQGLGFYVPTLRGVLGQFVEVDGEGHVFLRRGGG